MGGGGGVSNTGVDWAREGGREWRFWPMIMIIMFMIDETFGGIKIYAMRVSLQRIECDENVYK